MAIDLTYLESRSIPVEVEGITPEALVGKSSDDVRRMQVYVGNTEMALGELFRVEGDSSDLQLHWHGDLTGVHWIGAKMTSGRIRIHGAAGRHIGSEMSGGEILVDGDAGDWVGAEMRAGVIQVRGSAGHLVGAAYRGSQRGMLGGTIVIGGSVGNELGHTMRRGLIVVAGDAGDLIGFNMLAGTILVLGRVGIRHGAGMKRGTIGLLGNERPDLLPTFRYACRYQPQAMSLVMREVERFGVPIPDEINASGYQLFNGDLIEGGRGEILLRA